MNLLDNAIKYTPDGGKVSISVTRRYGHAVLEVADSGLGVSSTDLPHIFDRFYRADKARSPQLGGTGLGLSMSLACQVEIEHSAVIRKRRKTCKWSGFAVPAGQVEFGGRIGELRLQLESLNLFEITDGLKARLLRALPLWVDVVRRRHCRPVHCLVTTTWHTPVPSEIRLLLAADSWAVAAEKSLPV